MTGRPLLYWPGIKNDPGFMRVTKPTPTKSRKERHSGSSSKRANAPGKKERVSCKICQACISPDCGMCTECAEMPRFGGQGRSRKSCQMRQCLQPLLINSILCSICGLDGWYAESNMRLVDRPPGTCALMECSICYEVTHPTCMTDHGVDGYIKMELPNSWECPKCVKNGKAVKLEPSPLETAGTGKIANLLFKKFQLFF